MPDLILTTTKQRCKNYEQQLSAPMAPAAAERLRCELTEWIPQAATQLTEQSTQIAATFLGELAMRTLVAPRPGLKPYPLNNAEVLRYRFAGIGFTLGEVAFSAWLSTLVFAFNALVAALIGVIITIMITGGLRVYWGFLTRRFAHQPERAATLLGRAFSVTLALWLGTLATILFIARAAHDSSQSVDIGFAVLTTALSLLTPNAAALAFSLADLHAWSGTLSAEYQRVQLLVSQLAELGRRAQQLGKPSAGVAIVLALYLLLTPLGSAQSMGQIWLDQSGSVDVADAKAALHQTVQLVPEIARRTGAVRAELYGFAGDPFAARPASAVNLPGPFKKQPCLAQGAGSELPKLLRAPAEAARRATQERCAAQEQQAKQAYDGDLSTALNDAEQALLHASPVISQRTCLSDLFARLTYRAANPIAFVVVISDGIDTCHGHGVSPAPARSVKVALVLTRDVKSDQATAARFREVELQWRRRAPWLSAIVPPFALSPDFVNPMSQ